MASSQFPSALSSAVDSEMSAKIGPVTPRVHPLKYVRASKPFQIPHDRKRALAPFDDTPESGSDTHHYQRPKRRVRFLHLSRQMQPRVTPPHQRPQVVIDSRDALHQ